MLISETEYRHQVEEDIKPFRDILAWALFVTVGMMLNVSLVAANLLLVLAVSSSFAGRKFARLRRLTRLFGALTEEHAHQPVAVRWR